MKTRHVHQNIEECPNRFYDSSYGMEICPCLTQAEWEAFLRGKAERDARIRA